MNIQDCHCKNRDPEPINFNVTLILILSPRSPTSGSTISLTVTIILILSPRSPTSGSTINLTLTVILIFNFPLSLQQNRETETVSVSSCMSTPTGTLYVTNGMPFPCNSNELSHFPARVRCCHNEHQFLSILTNQSSKQICNYAFTP